MNKEITVNLSLHEMLQDTYSGKCDSLKKNIGVDKTILVGDIFNYLINSQADKLNPEGYTDDEIKLVQFVDGNYRNRDSVTVNILYKKNSGGEGYMQFNEKLSKYGDAFHEISIVAEYGNIKDSKESKLEVYLRAIPQDIGGKNYQ